MVVNTSEKYGGKLSEDINAFLKVMGLPLELRVLNTRMKTVSGYYDNADRLISDVELLSGNPAGYGQIEAIYSTINEFDSALVARSHNTLTPYARHTTSDHEIKRRNHLLIDTDPQRPVGISSTDEEHDLALGRAKEVMETLVSSGFPRPVWADSGNGGHLLFKIDLPNDDESRDGIKDFLEALAGRFDCDKVKIDTTVYNAARISKLYGTWVCKGYEVNGRHHRQSRILEMPDVLEIVPLEKIKEVTRKLTPEVTSDDNSVVQAARLEAERLAASNGDPRQAKINWVQAFLVKHEIETKPQQDYFEGVKWQVLSPCPFCEETDHNAVITVRKNKDGDWLPGYRCQHNRCKGNGWKVLSQHLEPDYNKKPSDPKPVQDYAIKFESWDETCAIAAQQVEDWWIDKWAEFGTLMLLTGLPFSGKSTLLAEVLGCMCNDRDWCDLEVKKVPFILLDLENKERILVKRLKRSLADGDGHIRELYHRVNPKDMPRPLTPEFIRSCVDALGNKIKGLGGKCVVVIDTMRSAFAGGANNELDPQEMVNLLTPLKQLAYDTGALVIVLHHNAKGSNKYSGNTAIAAVPDYMWNFRSDKNAKEATLEFDGRDDHQEPFMFVFDMQLQRNSYIGRASDVANKKRGETKDKELFEVIKHLSREERSTVGDVLDRLVVELSRDTVHRRLNSSAERGYAEKTSEGVGKPDTYRLTEMGNNLVNKLKGHALLEGTGCGHG